MSTMTPFQVAIREGRSFTLNRDGSLPALSSLMYLFTATDSNLKIQHIFANAFSADVSIELYSNPTIVTPFGTLVPGTDMFHNKRIGSLVAPKFTTGVSTTLAHVNPFGTLIDKEVLSESTTGSAGKFFSTSVGSEHGDCIDQGNLYLVKLTNTHATAASTIKLHIEIEQDAY